MKGDTTNNFVSFSPSGLDSDVVCTEYTGVPIRLFHNAVMYGWLMSGLIIFWCACTLVNYTYTYGYPQFGTPPSPNAFQSSRWNQLDYCCVFITMLNVLPPMTWFYALAFNRTEYATRLCRFVLQLMGFVNVALIILLLVEWFFLCNTSYSGGYTGCNDYRWCCVFFPSAWCPNSIPCTPAVEYAQLSRNAEATQTWAFLFFFMVFCWWMRSTWVDMREYGVFK